jgi:hypothetical protein
MALRSFSDSITTGPTPTGTGKAGSSSVQGRFLDNRIAAKGKKAFASGLVKFGGAGSGHFGHSGRPGKEGGSVKYPGGKWPTLYGPESGFGQSVEQRRASGSRLRNLVDKIKAGKTVKFPKLYKKTKAGDLVLMTKDEFLERFPILSKGKQYFNTYLRKMMDK